MHNLHAHLVFAAKYRRGVFDTEILNLCEQLMAQVCTGFGATLAEFNQKDAPLSTVKDYITNQKQPD